jgi:hypothetical protein
LDGFEHDQQLHGSQRTHQSSSQVQHQNAFLGAKSIVFLWGLGVMLLLKNNVNM